MAVLDINDTKVFDRIDTMVRGISSKYTGYSGIEFDDLYSELWIKVIKLVARIDDPEVLTYNLIATSLFNRAIDLCRAKKRQVQNTVQSDMSSISVHENIPVIPLKISPQGRITGQQVLGFCSSSISNCDMIGIIEIVDLFEKGTKERDYINYVAYYYCDCFIDYSYEDINDRATKNIRNELAIAKLLGYANDTSNGYRSLKKRVRQVINDQYLDN